MARAETRPHHPHLPYGECGGAGAVEMAGKTENDMVARYGLSRQGELARRTAPRIHAPMHRGCHWRTALVEWLGNGLPSRSQEFDPLTSLHFHVHDRHHDLDGDVSSDRGAGQGDGAFGACLSIGERRICPLIGQHGNGVRHVPQGVVTYPELTR